ncbi:MAG: hypothetical protein J6W06_06075 [Bacteroidales bacterium]|nr:hypothetical protein [Bacteroidales bacterium]
MDLSRFKIYSQLAAYNAVNEGNAIKKAFVNRKLYIAVLLCVLLSVNAMAWSGGNGTAGNPYIISSINELSKLNDTVSHYNASTRNDYAGKYFKLSDSFVSDYETNYVSFSIGYYTSSDQYPFCGSFDGNNKTLYQKRDLGRPYGALFAKLGPGAVVRNVVVSGSILAEGGYCAGIVAYSEGTSDHHVQIINCINNTTLTTKANGDYDYMGGIAAYIKYTDIDKCCNVGNIEAKNSGSQYIGGLVGYCYYISSIRNSYNKGQVLNSGSPSSSTYVNMGGCVGYILSQVGVNKSYLENCYNIGDVRTNNNYGAYIGGIVGACNGNVLNCYNGGTVSNEVSSSAAIAGYLLAYSEISNCYSRSNCGTKTGGTISLWGLKVYDADTPSDVSFFSHTVPAVNDDCVLDNTILSTTDLCTALNNWRTSVSGSPSLYSAWLDDVSPWDNKGMPRFLTCTPISVTNFSVSSGNRECNVSWTATGANSCILYYGSDPDINNMFLVNNAPSPFTALRLTNGRTYYFVVKPAGDGSTYCSDNPPSDAVSGTPNCP